MKNKILVIFIIFMWARARSTEVVIMDYETLPNEITVYDYTQGCECDCKKEEELQGFRSYDFWHDSSD